MAQEPFDSLTRREASQLAQGERPFDALTRREASQLAQGERPFDSLTRREASQLAQGERPFDSLTRRETAEIKSEIERTRIEMSETLGEIQERLRPDHLIQQAKETMTEAVTDAATGKVRNIMHSAGETATMVADQTTYAGRTVADYVRTHPVQMVLLAGGATWWLLRGRDRSDDREGASEGWQASAGSSHDERPALRDRVGGMALAARGRAQQASQRVGSAAHTASVRAQETWRRTSTSVDDWVHEYPLAAGAIAVALGAAVGLSVPRTEIENRALGERRDLAIERARTAAREITENVTQNVQDVAETVMDVAGDTITGSTTGPSPGRVS